MTQDFDSFFDENLDAYTDFLSKMDQSFADSGGVTKCLEFLSNQIDSLEQLATDQSSFEASFSALNKILNEPRPSQLEVRAAIAIVIHITMRLFLAFGEKFEELDEVHDGIKQSDELVEVLEKKVQAYRWKSGGNKSGATRSRQKDDDLHSAAMAYKKISDDYRVLSPGLKDIADQLDRDRTPMAFPAKGGWTQRVKDLTLKAIVSHARTVSRE
ncbi:MAG: hypothetical protein K0U72_07225 [Gammaproteobacteria bacterium]|nr:hypothetical protein [Gammaproteobacteria bacterium]